MSEGFGEVRPPGANVPGWLLPASIVVTLFCCLPTGIAAIVYSVQARSKSQVGDYAGASHAARNARIWVIASVVLGVLAIIAYVVFVVILGVVGGSVQDQYGLD